MKFWLGTHHPHWLRQLDVPLFISHRRLKSYKTLPVARMGWALDSGGFTELSKYGGWKTTVDEYVEAVVRYESEIGQLVWAAPMDWMCEPSMIVETGLCVREHQDLTIINYLELQDRGPFIPVLQGWTLKDYETCLDLYRQAGVDLSSETLVGVGSVCRRQATSEIGQIMQMLYEEGINAHGFGVKKLGVRAYSHYLASADSMAWSFRARRSDPLPGHTHINCANCSEFALMWREDLLRDLLQSTEDRNRILLGYQTLSRKGETRMTPIGGTLTPNAPTGAPAPVEPDTTKADAAGTEAEKSKKKAEPRDYDVVTRVSGTADKLHKAIDDLFSGDNPPVKGEITIKHGTANGLQPRLAVKAYAKDHTLDSARFGDYETVASGAYTHLGKLQTQKVTKTTVEGL